MPEDTSPKERMEVRLVASPDDMMAALLIRSAVYVGEMDRLLSTEMDGNDTSASHLIATVDGRPVGTIRIRYMAGFAIIERIAVLKQYRRGRYGRRGVAWELGAKAIGFCRAKGYTRFYGCARDGLVDFWKRFAPAGAVFEVIEGTILEREGLRAFPMEGVAPPLAGAVVDMSDHWLLNSSETRVFSLVETGGSSVAAP